MSQIKDCNSCCIKRQTVFGLHSAVGVVSVGMETPGMYLSILTHRHTHLRCDFTQMHRSTQRLLATGTSYLAHPFHCHPQPRLSAPSSAASRAPLRHGSSTCGCRHPRGNPEPCLLFFPSHQNENKAAGEVVRDSQACCIKTREPTSFQQIRPWTPLSKPTCCVGCLSCGAPQLRHALSLGP